MFFVIIYSAIDQGYIGLSLASCNKDEIWDLRAELGLTWDHFRALVPIATKSQIWDIIMSTVLVIWIFSFPRPNFPKPRPRLNSKTKFFWNRDFFSETETETFFQDQIFSKPKPRLFSETETETLKDLAKVSKPKCQSLVCICTCIFTCICLCRSGQVGQIWRLAAAVSGNKLSRFHWDANCPIGSGRGSVRFQPTIKTNWSENNCQWQCKKMMAVFHFQCRKRGRRWNPWHVNFWGAQSPFLFRDYEGVANSMTWVSGSFPKCFVFYGIVSDSKIFNFL